MTPFFPSFRSAARRSALPCVWFATLYYFWSVRYGDFLYALQENSLFLFRADFATRWFAEPAGVLGYCAAFIIQFGAYPLLGGAALAGLGTALFLGVARAFRLHGAWQAFAILPTLALCVAATWNSYYVYAPHNASLVVSGLLGANVAVWSRVLYIGLSPGWLRACALSALCLPGYCAFGVWFTTLALLCGLSELFSSQRGWRRFALVSLVACLTPPLAYSLFYYDHAPESVVWRCGLLDDLLDSQDSRASFYVMFGVYSSLAFLALFAFGRALSTFLVELRSRSHSRSQSRRARKLSKDEKPVEPNPKVEGRRRARIALELTVIFAFACFYLSFQDEPFFQIMAQNRALNSPDWAERVLELDVQTRRPCEHSVALRNVALFETGALADRAFDRPVSGFNAYGLNLDDFERASGGDTSAARRLARFRARRTTQSAALFSTSEFILCRYGQTNIAARCAMNKMVGCLDRSVACFKTLAYCALVSGERELARRYLTELNETLFHRDYARLGLAYLETEYFAFGVRDSLDAPTAPTVRSGSLTYAEAARQYGVALADLTRFADDVARSRRMRPLKNVKELDAFPDLMRLYGVFTDEFSAAPRELQEAELIASLFQRGDFQQVGDGFFLAHIEEYVSRYEIKRLPKALEEGYATLRFDKYGDAWNQCAYQFSPETTAAFNEYVEFYHTVGGKLKSKGAQAAILECCQGTYWGYMKDESAFLQFNGE